TLDIMMPGIDGWQVLAALKHAPATRNIPVFICSIIEEQERGLSLGAEGYLVKPVLEEDLLRALSGLKTGPTPPAA
ncbi:MAG TPA: response regulator, partial [Anaerolineales bacterium]